MPAADKKTPLKKAQKESQKDTQNKAQKKKAPRLGRGLSSLMSAPAAITPANTGSTPAQAPATQAGTAQATKSSPEISDSSRGVIENHADQDKTAGRGAEAHKVVSRGVSDPVVQEIPDSSKPALSYIPISQITPNPHQPRQDFDDTALHTLAESIKTEGVMQPILIRPAPTHSPTSPAYEIIAGERRWRSAQAADLKTIPAIVRQLDEQQLAEWSLVENLQRQDLNPIERALAFHQLIQNFGLTHNDIAQRVGLDRSTISNLIRLLDLSEDVQALVRSNRLSTGHAKAIAPIPTPAQQLELARQVIAKNLSVRQTELAARKILNPTTPTSKSNTQPHLSDLQDKIGQALQTKVAIRKGRKKGSGTLAIDFYSLDQFDNLMQRLGINIDS